MQKKPIKKAKVKTWTIDEEALIKELASQEYSEENVKKLSRRLKRTFKSVNSKLWRIRKGINKAYPKKNQKVWAKTVPPHKKPATGQKNAIVEKSSTSIALLNSQKGVKITPNSIIVDGFSEIRIVGKKVVVAFC